MSDLGSNSRQNLGGGSRSSINAGSRSNLRSKSKGSRSSLTSKSKMQSPSKLRVASKHRLHGGMDGDDGNDWLQAKDPVRPDDQLELTEEELKVELTRILRADNPHAPDNIVRFSHKEGAYRQMSSVEQCAFHFSMPAVMVHVDSEEARRMAVRRRFSKQPPATTTAEAGTGGGDEGEASGTAEAGTSTGEDAPDEGVGGDGEGGVGEATEGGNDEEAAPEAEAEAEEEDGDDDNEVNKPLRNQFNFSERASQTYNYAMRERGTMTEAPARAVYGATATQWAMYDAYSADLERQAAAKEKSTKKKTVKEEKRNAAANPLSRDPNDEAASGWTAAAKIVDHSVARKIERMCNQNTFDDVAQDFKYWDDPSDSFKEGEASLLPLWKLTYEKARKRTVTCMAWCPGYWDLLFVGFGSYDYTKQGAGVIAAYSLKNPSFPEYTVDTDNGVMCIDVHPEQPSLLAVGFYNGEVAVYDLSRKHERDKPLHRSTAKTGKHMDPVWQVQWHADDVDKNRTFSSVSSDGRVTTWTLVKTELQHTDVIRLALDATALIEKDPSQPDPLFGLGSGTCFAFNNDAEHLFLVGTEEGQIHKCSRAYTSKFLHTYASHSMAVYTVAWNPFHPRVFISCSADWTVKIWDHTFNEPIFAFDLGNAVGDVAWSPYSATVFVAVTTDGNVFAFDLAINKYEAVCVQQVVKKAKLTHVSFNPTHPMVTVGDDRGAVSTFKVSPNLRKSFNAKKGVDREAQQAALDKLLDSVKEVDKTADAGAPSSAPVPVPEQ